jgi:DNA repair exonuclease SbcCD nuclease subunit
MTSEDDCKEDDSKDKASVTLPGTVEKIIKPIHPSLPEKAQISVESADDLYREIRIDNALTDENGDPVRLKEGTPVEVTVEADPKDTDKPEAEEKRRKRSA